MKITLRSDGTLLIDGEWDIVIPAHDVWLDLTNLPPGNLVTRFIVDNKHSGPVNLGPRHEIP